MGGERQSYNELLLQLNRLLDITGLTTSNYNLNIDRLEITYVQEQESCRTVSPRKIIEQSPNQSRM